MPPKRTRRSVFASTLTRWPHWPTRADCAGIPLVQISTDYVFAGSADQRIPFSETDPPEPLSVYARLKLAGETAALAYRQALVVRTCGLYGLGGPNFVETMLRLGCERNHLRIVGDQFCTPSSADDVARAIHFLLTGRHTGIIHVVNLGSTSWCRFAREIFRAARLNVTVDEISTTEYGAVAPRPAYSVLDTSRYETLGGPLLPTWQAALQTYLSGRRPALDRRVNRTCPGVGYSTHAACHLHQCGLANLHLVLGSLRPRSGHRADDPFGRPGPAELLEHCRQRGAGRPSSNRGSFGVHSAD